MKEQMEMIAPEALMNSLANQVVKLLSEHTDTMLQFSAQQILEFVENNLGVMLTNPDCPGELVAFAKLYPWAGKNEKGQLLFELGSWLVAERHQGKKLGGRVLLETMAKGLAFYPGSQFIAVVEAGNLKSQQIIQHFGGKLLAKEDWPSNFQVILQEGQASVLVFDISEVKHPEKLEQR